MRSLIRHHDCDIPDATRDAVTVTHAEGGAGVTVMGAHWFRRFWEPCLACAAGPYTGQLFS